MRARADEFPIRAAPIWPRPHLSNPRRSTRSNEVAAVSNRAVEAWDKSRRADSSLSDRLPSLK